MITITPFQEKHIPLFTAWFNALPHNNVWTPDWVRYKTLDNPDYDPELMIAAEDHGQPMGFALSTLARETSWINAFVVDPACRRQGVGTALFDALEPRLEARGVPAINAGYAPPRYFLPGIDLAYTDAIVFLDQRGYRTTRETRVNMEVPLASRDYDTAPGQARLRDHGMTVRRATAQDKAGITALCEKENHLGWIIETAMGLEREPVPVFVAERGGEICAFATHSVIGPTHFGPMLTASELRGLGVGSVLLKLCLQDWQRAGYTQCEIIWAGPLAFYARTVGAQINKAFWAFRKELAA